MVAEVWPADKALQEECAEGHQEWNFDTYQGINHPFLKATAQTKTMLREESFHLQP